jgi:hypothetical protein
VLERVPDVVGAPAALADALRHQLGAAVQVELATVLRMVGIGDEGQRPDAAPARDAHGHQPRVVHAPAHFPVPQPSDGEGDVRGGDAEGHAPARAAAAQPHHQPGAVVRAPVAGGKDAQRPVVAAQQCHRALAEEEARRPHQRAVAEHPEVAAREHGAECREIHDRVRIGMAIARRIIESARQEER